MCNFLCCVEEVWWTTDAGKWRTHDCTTSTNTSSTFTPNLMSLRISHVSESLNLCPNLLDIWFTVFIHISTYPLSELLIDQSVITTNVARNTIAIFHEKRVFRDPKASPTLMMHKRGSNPQPCDLWPRKLPLHHWPLEQNEQTFSVHASSLHFHSCAISSLILSELYSHYRLLSS